MTMIKCLSGMKRGTTRLVSSERQPMTMEYVYVYVSVLYPMVVYVQWQWHRPNTTTRVIALEQCQAYDMMI